MKDSWNSLFHFITNIGNHDTDTDEGHAKEHYYLPPLDCPSETDLLKSRDLNLKKSDLLRILAPEILRTRTAETDLLVKSAQRSTLRWLVACQSQG